MNTNHTTNNPQPNRTLPRVSVERHIPRRIYTRNYSDILDYNRTYFNRNYQRPNYGNLEDVIVYTNHRTVNQNSELNLCRHDNVLCVICQENMHKNDIVRKLTCNHYFHHCCIDKWLETNKKCPLCNYELI